MSFGERVHGYVPLAKAALGVLGVPGPVLAAVDAAGQITGLAPDHTRQVHKLTQQAGSSLAKYAGQEYRNVADADKDYLRDCLTQALTNPTRPGLLVAGVQGRDVLKAFLVAEPSIVKALAGWGPYDDAARYFDGLVDNVSTLLTRWIRSDEIISLATMDTVAVTLATALQSLKALTQTRGDLADLTSKVEAVLTSPGRVSRIVVHNSGDGAVIAERITQEVQQGSTGHIGGYFTNVAGS